MNNFSRFLLFLTLVSPCVVKGQSVLFVAHVQSKYAGGGGCIEYFDVHWTGDNPITNIQIKFELSSKTDEPLQEVINIDRLGNAAIDNDASVNIETARCFQNNASITIKEASALNSGKKIDLFKSGQLKVGNVIRYPVKLRPTHHSSGTPNGAPCILPTTQK